MPTFTYKAKDITGKTIRDQVIAKDRAEALLNLRQLRLMVISIREGERSWLFAFKPKRIKLSQLAQFSRQLSTLIIAGMPLAKDLRVLANQFEDKRLRQITTSLYQHIEAGASLSEALGNYSGVFNPLYINMVAAGETSGALGEILARLAGYLEKTDILIRRVKSALIYPAAIITVAIGLCSFLILVVIPRFKDIFLNLGGASLPLPTQILISVSDFSLRYFFYFLIIGFVMGVAIGRYINTSGGKLRFENFKLRLPLFGELFQKFAIARFSRTLSILLRSGVPILNSLEIAAKTAGNKAVEAMIMDIRQQVSQGQRMTTQMAKEKFFPQMVVEMVGVGEESGQLEPMLNKIADSYEEAVETTISGLLSLLEPAIIIFLAAVVGSIVLAMFLPIIKITELIGGGQ